MKVLQMLQSDDVKLTSAETLRCDDCYLDLILDYPDLPSSESLPSLLEDDIDNDDGLRRTLAVEEQYTKDDPEVWRYLHDFVYLVQLTQD